MDFVLKLPERIQKTIIDKNITSIEKIIKTSYVNFKAIGLNEKEVTLLKAVAAKALNNKSGTASALAVEGHAFSKRISFGCVALDEICRNGIATRGITEICGVSSSGKSQICMQLALVVQLAEERGGLGKGVVYLCTEDAFPSKRLHQMAQSCSKRFGSIGRPVDFLDSIFLEHISDSEKLLDCVLHRLPSLMRTKPIGLIVIDSVGAIFRLETNAISRANSMRRLVLGLQALSDEHSCAIICVNQVTSVIGDTNNKLIPCLGLAWSNLVTTRIQIHKTDDFYIYNAFDEQNVKVDEIPLTVRKFEILFSPDLAPNCAEFLISPEGVIDVQSGTDKCELVCSAISR